MPHLTQSHLSWDLWQLTANLMDLNINSQNSEWELWSEKLSGKISQKHFLHFYVNNSSICSFVRNLSDLNVWCSISTIGRLWGLELNQQTVKSSACMRTYCLFVFQMIERQRGTKRSEETTPTCGFHFSFSHTHTCTQSATLLQGDDITWLKGQPLPLSFMLPQLQCLLWLKKLNWNKCI